ncbi:unnamed protein product [Spodoptera exigua]|nr:unnamed protein product [Spodoptera exigua]
MAAGQTSKKLPLANARGLAVLQPCQSEDPLRNTLEKQPKIVMVDKRADGLPGSKHLAPPMDTRNTKEVTTTALPASYCSKKWSYLPQKALGIERRRKAHGVTRAPKIDYDKRDPIGLMFSQGCGQDILTRKELQHANILPYLTSFVHGKELYVVSPLMTFGSCRDILDRYFQEGLPELACALVLRDVLQALQYLHKQLYIHRSVRASHVLVGANGGVRLSGLRSAASLMVRGRRQRHLHQLPPPDADNTNLMWLSPELLEQNLKGYDEKSDIYSLGVLCCELANGAVPFAEVPTTLMFTEKVRGSRPQLLDCSTFPEPCLDDSEMKSMYNTDSGVGDSADGVMRLRQLYAARKLSDTFHHLSEMALQR